MRLVEASNAVVEFLLKAGASALARSSNCFHLYDLTIDIFRVSGLLTDNRLPILTVVSSKALESSELVNCAGICQTIQAFRFAGFDLGDSMQGGFDYTCWLFLPHIFGQSGSTTEKTLFYEQVLEWFFSYSVSSVPYAGMYSPIVLNMAVQAFCASLCSLDSLRRICRGVRDVDFTHAALWFSHILSRRFLTADKLAEILKLACDRVGTLHFESPIGSRKTFLLRVMGRPKAVSVFLSSLNLMNVRLDQFVEDEISFHESQGWETGWTRESFFDLLTLNPETIGEVDYSGLDQTICGGCGRFTLGTDLEPLSPWHRRLERIKKRIKSVRPTDEETEQLRRWLVWKEKGTYLYCQDLEGKTVSEESEREDEEWSPFQINWN